MASSPPPSTPAAQPTPSADTQPYAHQCFICLLNDLETPTEPFVNPCPCTLEAHESCLLRWVAESESNRTSTSSKPLRCPACHARIRVDEPPDAVVALRDTMSRSFARVSPYVLLSLVVGGGAVGSAWYGLLSAHLFAGPVATARWLGLQTLVNRRPSVPVWRWMPMWTFTAKIWALSLVGPALTIGRAIPAVGNILLVPASLMSAAILVSFDDMPTWPPSPAWAATLFPFVSLTYSNIYYEFFGTFERRLNRALRARPAEEDREALPRREGDVAGQQGGGEGQQGGDNQDQSVWAAMWGLGQAVVGLFHDQELQQEIVLEAEVVPHRRVQGDVAIQIEVGGEEQFDDEEAQAMAQEFQEILAEVDAVAGEQLQQQLRAAAEGAPPVPQVDNAEPAPQQQQQEAAPAPQVQNNGNNDDDPAPAGDNNRAVGGTLTDIMSSIALSLLYPSICFGVGEVLRVGLPRSWVTRPAPAWGSRPQATGLLQRRWGRSLVGGCMYVVLKDAFTLYAKYRQVQQKRKRKVRNVERRRETST
ncbi:hypothetical protein CONLIGDRAFT_667545 [Coniochaeta ligniaria NRRL 30616]|uniref:RING-CH-type domain-containing protein n=1 Tax=Coniochaeta ligniaria NRRL 30616 TaxID=1408157 RepID=A0A1J7JP54_9PEZI|nr:hypothetical protein CONLIGDRAFT_667545 [Coniochaeta ligniaria NRRL 30616]